MFLGNRVTFCPPRGFALVIIFAVLTGKEVAIKAVVHPLEECIGVGLMGEH